MFEAEKAREAEAKEKQKEEMKPNSGGSSRTPNSMNGQSPPTSSGSDLSRNETVRYINDGESDEDEDMWTVE